MSDSSDPLTLELEKRKREIDAIPRNVFYHSYSRANTGLDRKLAAEIRKTVENIDRQNALEEDGPLLSEEELVRVRDRIWQEYAKHEEEERVRRQEAEEMRVKQIEAAKVYENLEKAILSYRVEGVPLLSPFVYDPEVDLDFVLDAIREFETTGKVTPLSKPQIESIRNSLLIASRSEDRPALSGAQADRTATLDDELRNRLVEDAKREGLEIFKALGSRVPDGPVLEKIAQSVSETDADRLNVLQRLAGEEVLPVFDASRNIEDQWKNPLPMHLSRL